MIALYFSVLHLTYKFFQRWFLAPDESVVYRVYEIAPVPKEDKVAQLQQSTLPSEEKADDRIFRAVMAGAMYLGRNSRVNPTVFLDWGQEIAEKLRTSNFSEYGSLEINDCKTIFMRNIRLLISKTLFRTEWVSRPYTLSVEAFNSNTGKTSFDLTLRWFHEGHLIATLVRKMVYVSATTGKPIPLPEQFVQRNPDQNTVQFSLNKDVPSSASKSTIAVRPSDIDFNNHVGHPVYVDYVLDSAYHSTYQLVSSDLMCEEIRCIDIEYRYPIVLDRAVSVRSWDGIEEGSEGGVEVNFVMYQRAAGRQTIEKESSDSVDLPGNVLQSNAVRSTDKESNETLSTDKHSEEKGSDKLSDVKQIVCLAKVLFFDM